MTAVLDYSKTCPRSTKIGSDRKLEKYAVVSKCTPSHFNPSLDLKSVHA